MARTRGIQAAEARLWLEMLLTYAFGSTPAQRDAQLDILDIAHDAISFPDDIPSPILAGLLLHWADQYVPTEDWQRLQSRIRKRRSSS
ncbi:hypothetical protein EI168_17710 [Halomonas sp. FME1]|uniref:Uncharacterized protein n=1 Tax=Halomonas casei TaxID=2742613 RepID=A0ABR9F9P3_9GAMM|nr:hypothetical protein [Halomonas casei]MBE0401915.1 hypothetical protein [Halomonas casei]